MSSTTTTVNNSVITAIYKYAADLTAGATTQDPVWWEDIHEQISFLLREAMGQVTRPEESYLPTLGFLEQQYFPAPPEYNNGKGWYTPHDKQQVYVPAAVWYGDKLRGGGGPTVSVEEALELGAIPGTIDFATGKAQWPRHHWD
jgi:hypothetical protein